MKIIYTLAKVIIKTDTIDQNKKGITRKIEITKFIGGLEPMQSNRQNGHNP